MSYALWTSLWLTTTTWRENRTRSNFNLWMSVFRQRRTKIVETAGLCCHRLDIPSKREKIWRRQWRVAPCLQYCSVVRHPIDGSTVQQQSRWKNRWTWFGRICKIFFKGSILEILDRSIDRQTLGPFPSDILVMYSSTLTWEETLFLFFCERARWFN
jgi:hypothetical protein